MDRGNKEYHELQQRPSLNMNRRRKLRSNNNSKLRQYGNGDDDFGRQDSNSRGARTMASSGWLNLKRTSNGDAD